jgi:hypothetical protein
MTFCQSMFGADHMSFCRSMFGANHMSFCQSMFGADHMSFCQSMFGADHMSFCQSMFDLLSAIKLCVRFQWNFVLCASCMKICSMAVILHFMAQMNFLPILSIFICVGQIKYRWAPGHATEPLWVAWHSVPWQPHFIHGVNNPLLLLSTILILFGCNSQQMFTTIHWVAVSFVKICVLAVTLHVAVQTNLNLYFPHLLSDWGEIWYKRTAKLYCSEFVSLLTLGTGSPSLPYGCKWNNIFTCTVHQYDIWQYRTAC